MSAARKLRAPRVAPAAPLEFVEPPRHERDWTAHEEAIDTRDGRRVIRTAVNRKIFGALNKGEYLDHRDWLYSAWEPILPGARYSVTSPSGRWGRVDTALPPAGRQFDLGEQIEFELKQRVRAYRLISTCCPETKSITGRYHARGEIRLFAYPWVALEEARAMDAADRQRRGAE